MTHAAIDYSTKTIKIYRHAYDGQARAAIAELQLATAPVPSLVTQVVPQRPGDGIGLYGSSKTGEPAEAVLLDPAWTAVSPAGRVARIDAATAGDPQTVAMLAPIGLEAGRKYDVRWTVQRVANPADPLNDSVSLGLQWLTQAKTANGSTTIENIPLVVADGVQSRSTRVVAGQAAVPAGTVYFRPYIDLFGDSHVTDVIVITVDDVTAAASSIIVGDDTDLEPGTTGNVFVGPLSGPSTIRLPAPMEIGHQVRIKDIGGTTGDYWLTVDGNGRTIGGQATRLIDAADGSLELIWSGADWAVIDQQPPNTGDVRPAALRIKNDGSIIPADRFAALATYMQAKSGANNVARYPKLGALPLLLPPGDYRAGTFTPLETWGNFTHITGAGPVSVLDNIGIAMHDARAQLVERLFLGQRDRVVAAETYGVWQYGSLRHCNVRDLYIADRDFAFKFGDERKAFGPGQVVATSIAQSAIRDCDVFECNYGFRIYYGQYNTITGGHVLGCRQYALDVYCGTLGRFIGTELKGRSGNIRIRAASRGALTDSYLLNLECGGGSDARQIPILSVVDDGGFARFVLSTSMPATVGTASAVTWYDPVQRRAYSQLVMANTVVGGQVEQINVGGVNLLAAAVPWQGTLAATITAVVNAVNSNSGTSGWLAMAAGGRMYVDSAAKDDDSKLGLTVATTVSGGMILTPDAVVQVNCPGHGYTVADVKNEIEFNYDGPTAIVQGSINGTVLTVTRIWNNTFVPLNVPIVGSTFGVADRVVSAPIAVNADGTGTYTLSIAAGVQPVQTIIIGHAGVCPIRALSGDTLWTDAPSAFYLTPSGNVTRHFRLSPGLLHVDIFNGSTQIFNDIGIKEVSPTSILTDVPFGDVPSLSGATVRVDNWDTDYCAMDTSANRINDIQEGLGNRNNVLHRSTDHCQYYGVRLKTSFWIDNRANDAFKTRRLVIIRSGRGRRDDPADVEVTPITGSPYGWATLSADFGSTAGPDFKDGMALIVPDPNKPMIGNVPQTVELSVSALFARALRGGTEEILQPSSIVYVPASGAVINALAGDEVILNHPADIAALTVQLGPGVTGNMITISSRQAAVTALTISSGVGDVVDWTTAALAAGGQLKFRKQDAIGAWTRSLW